MEHSLCRCEEWREMDDVAYCNYCYNVVFDDEGLEYCETCVKKSYHQIKDKVVCRRCGNKDIEHVLDEDLKEIIKTHFTPELKYNRLGKTLTNDLMKLKALQEKIETTERQMNDLIVSTRRKKLSKELN